MKCRKRHISTQQNKNILARFPNNFRFIFHYLYSHKSITSSYKKRQTRLQPQLRIASLPNPTFPPSKLATSPPFPPAKYKYQHIRNMYVKGNKDCFRCVTALSILVCVAIVAAAHSPRRPTAPRCRTSALWLAKLQNAGRRSKSVIVLRGEEIDGRQLYLSESNAAAKTQLSKAKTPIPPPFLNLSRHSFIKLSIKTPPAECVLIQYSLHFQMHYSLACQSTPVGPVRRRRAGPARRVEMINSRRTVTQCYALTEC